MTLRLGGHRLSATLLAVVALAAVLACDPDGARRTPPSAAPEAGPGSFAPDTVDWADRLLAAPAPAPGVLPTAPSEHAAHLQTVAPDAAVASAAGAAARALDTNQPAPGVAPVRLLPVQPDAAEADLASRLPLATFLPTPQPTAMPSHAWLVTTAPSVLYRSWMRDEALAQVSGGTYFRLLGNPQNDRYYVRQGLSGSVGWLPRLGTAPWAEPNDDELRARLRYPDPRVYLYARWPDTARRMDCVIWYESGWNPRARNSESDASGLAQFIAPTWLRTPHGQAGFSRFDPFAAVDAFGWMVHGGGSWAEWETVQVGFC